MKYMTQTNVSSEDFSGVYFNAAYGSVTLCSPTSATKNGCEFTLSQVASTIKGRKPDLVASWDKLWSSHLLFMRQAGNHFIVRSYIIFPAPSPNSTKEEDNKPFAVEFGRMNISASFVQECTANGQGNTAGFAMTGVWGAGPEIQRRVGEDKEGAEVWFDKVA